MWLLKWKKRETQYRRERAEFFAAVKRLDRRSFMKVARLAAAVTAETYPKFQTQLQKVAALRDMINWRIENPLKGKPLALDDARLLAFEAYITAQRTGVTLEPGKH